MSNLQAWSNGWDVCVAETAEQAKELMLAHWLAETGPGESEGFDEPWKVIPPDTFIRDGGGEPDGDDGDIVPGTETGRTVAEFMAEGEGPRYLFGFDR
jgi:hypothetical protein